MPSMYHMIGSISQHLGENIGKQGHSRDSRSLTRPGNKSELRQIEFLD